MLKITKVLSADDSAFAFKVGAKVRPGLVQKLEHLDNNIYVFEYTFITPDGSFWGKYEAVRI